MLGVYQYKVQGQDTILQLKGMEPDREIGHYQLVRIPC